MTQARITHMAMHVLSVPGGVEARVTQMVVQTFSDADSTGEGRVTQMVVQTFSDAGELTVTDGAPDDAATGKPTVFVAEIDMAVDTDGTLATFLVTDGDDFATRTTDTPANTIVHPRLMQPANLERTMFSGRTTFGAVEAGYGLAEIANPDGLYDAWADYSVAGQRFVLRSGTPGTPYPSQWVTVLRATMQSIECDLDRVRIRLRDRIELCERALLRDTSYPDPAVVGNVLSVTPKLVDAARLIYAVGRPPAGKRVVIQSLRDNGLPIPHTSGSIGDYASTIDTEGNVTTASVPAGRFNWNAHSGRLKVGTKPAGTLTATLFVIDDSATWSGLDQVSTNGKIGTMLSQLAQAAGVPAADIDSGDVVAVDLACGATNFGYWDDSEARVLDAMQAVANSLGIWFGFDRLDRLRMGQLSAPEGDPDWTVTQHNMIAGSLRRVTTSDPGRGVPVWRVVARSAHNDAPTTTFAGAVSEANKAALQPEWPVETADEDAAILTWCPAATELVVDVYSGGTGPTATAAAVPGGDAGEAERRLALLGGATEMVTVDLYPSPLALTRLDLGAVVRLKSPRYGWGGAGVDFVVVGVRTS